MSFWKSDRQTRFKYILASALWLAFAILFMPFYSEILLAGVFALAMHPFLGRLLEKRHLRWRTSVALILALMFVGLAFPITVVLYKGYAYVVEVSKTGLQNTPVFQKMMFFKSEAVNIANRTMNKLGVENQFDLGGLSEESLSRVANYILQLLSQTAYQIPAILLSLFVFCASLYFFLAEASPLKRIFQRQQVLSYTEVDRLIEILQKSSYNTVVSSVLIAVLQGTMVSVGSAILGVGDFVVVWVITFFCSFIPVIGAGPVALALGVSELFFSNYGTAIGFVILAAVVGTVDNLIRPYLIASSEEDLNPIVSLLSLVGALILFGMPGLFLGPVIAAVSIKIIPALWGEPEPKVTASGNDRV